MLNLCQSKQEAWKSYEVEINLPARSAPQGLVSVYPAPRFHFGFISRPSLQLATTQICSIAESSTTPPFSLANSTQDAVEVSIECQPMSRRHLGESLTLNRLWSFFSRRESTSCFCVGSANCPRLASLSQLPGKLIDRLRDWKTNG
jgi:hypothetical protein